MLRECVSKKLELATSPTVAHGCLRTRKPPSSASQKLYYSQSSQAVSPYPL